MSLLSPFQVEKQRVDDAINVVCDRLEHATLLQDRRAAVLSIKGFAREYKESVTAGGLRGLLKSLSIDREDDETLNATLECLLTLFTADGSGRADDTALWIADEFTLRPENVHNLIDIIADSNFHTRLRSIQIMACILECRTQQLQECVMNSPTGTNTLVGVLEDRREQVRNEGLLLLLKLVRGHVEIQKRVAFENAFEKVLAIVDEEGGLMGGIIAADSLTLLNNLLSGNASNQNWFRETEFFKAITKLLQGIDKNDTNFATGTIQNTTSLLRLVRLFVPHKGDNRMINQTAFLKSGLITQIIGLIYANSVPSEIRTESLLSAADLIYSNAELQDYFVKASAIANNSTGSTSDKSNVSALLSLILGEPDEAFSLRYAAMSCIQAFASGNADRRLRLVETILEQYRSSADDNLLDCILNSAAPEHQHKTWFACCTMMQLTYEDDEARETLTAQTVGDAAAGEEEVTLIQSVSACLVVSLQAQKTRSAVAYAMLLSLWLFDSKENVADFLEEGSTLQAIIAALMSDNVTELKGVLAILLSICYAFDFMPDSPINRAALQTIMQRLGRDAIVNAIADLSHATEVSQQVTPQSGLQQGFLLDAIFVEFFKDNFGLIRKAVDQPPAPVRTKKEEKAREEQDRTEDIIADLEEDLERKSSGLEEAVIIIKTRQEEVQRLREEIRYTNEKHKVECSQLQQDLGDARQQAVILRAEATRNSNEIENCLKESSRLHSDLEKKRMQFEALQEGNATSVAAVERLKQELQSEASKRSFLEKELASFRESSGKAVQEADSARKALVKVQQDFEVVTREATAGKLENSTLTADLAAARSTLKKVESEATISRTRARDLDSELKGVQHELNEARQQTEKDSTKALEEKQELEQEISTLQSELQALNGQLSDTQEDHNNKLNALQKQKDSELAALQRSFDERTKALEDSLLSIADLKAKVRAIKEESSETKISSKDTNGVADSGEADKIKKLEAQVTSLQGDKLDLQKQLEQAQEDLMLLMEDDGGEGDEEADDNGDVD